MESYKIIIYTFIRLIIKKHYTFYTLIYYTIPTIRSIAMSDKKLNEERIGKFDVWDTRCLLLFSA